MLLLFAGCESSRVNPVGSQHSTSSSDAIVGIDPSNFAVPEIAFEDFAINQFAGGIRFESESFSRWLEQTGQFGELVALSDRRIFALAIDAKSRRPNQQNQVQELQEFNEGDPDSTPENRVCDLAYQLIYEKYKVDPLGYRNNLDARDAVITVLIKTIRAKTDPNDR